MKYFPHILFLLLVAGVASAAPSVIYQRTILPEADSTYELGTSTRAWLRVNSDIFCLTGDSCITSWPGGGGGSGTISTSSALTAGLLVQSTGAATIANIATSSLGLLTTDVAEGTNLYYTLSRWASALAGTTTDALAEGSTNQYWTLSRFASALAGTTTSALAEGTNLYFTDARARSALSVSGTGLAYDNGTGVFSLASGYSIPLTASTTEWANFYATPSTRITAGTGIDWSGNTLNVTLADFSTTNLSEGTNLYYTDARVGSYITGSSTLPAFLNYWTLSGSDVYRSTGNVGIATSTPGRTFSVAGTGLFSGLTTFESGFNIGASTFTSLLGNGLTNVGGTLTVSTTSLASGFFQQGGNSFGATAVLGTNDSNNLAFETSGSTRMTIDTSGNVGIGTTTPTRTLSVSGTLGSTPIVYIGSPGTSQTLSMGTWYGGATANSWIDANGALVLNPSGGGNVGIGTTSPNERLDVTGNIGASGYLGLGNANAADRSVIRSDFQGRSIYMTPATAGYLVMNQYIGTEYNLDRLVNFQYTPGTTGAQAGVLNIGQLTKVNANYTHGVTAFYTNGAERMRISNSGNVGIGTTTPGTILSIGSAADYINLSNTATSTFAFGIQAPSINLSGFLQAVSGIFTSILTIPYNAALSLVSNGDIGIDSTSNQFQYRSGGATKVLGDGNFYPAFSYATSTAWTGTTTIPLGPAYTGETWNGVKCFTDTGTLNVSFYDGTNRMNMFNASTTVGTVGLVTNNTFTADEKRYVDIGTPASSPTKVSCTVSKSLSPD